MRTLLVDQPSLLSDAEKIGLMDNAYCKELGLQISNFGLIRKIERGRHIKEHSRYWKDAYGDFYVCSEWNRRHHCNNAESLLAFVKGISRRNTEHEDTLRPHAQAFHEYLAGNCSSPTP